MNHLFKHIQKEYREYKTDYIILLTAGSLFVITMFLFQGMPTLQYAVLVAFTGIYIIWGILHHKKNKSLSLKTVIEYVLIGFTIIFLLKLIIFPR